MNPNPSKTIVLIHAACTGGSLLYRVLTQSLGCLGLNEIGFGKRPAATMFNSWDPECQLWASGKISDEQFANIFYSRIQNCESLAKACDKHLLVREHSHTFFFKPDDIEKNYQPPSWIASKIEQETGQFPFCILTVRNPVDSWLGYRRNFAHEDLDQFNEYCSRYNRWLDSCDQLNSVSEKCLIVKYEDFIADAQVQMNRVTQFLECPQASVDLSQVGSKIGSGNSGRISSSLQKRSRRPFPYSFIRVASSSDEYRKLCKRLGYAHMPEHLETGDIIRSVGFQFVHIANRLLLSFKKPLQRIANKSRVANS